MTDAYAGSKPPSQRDDALAVVQRLRDSGHIAYLAGGCVRDMVMGREPQDYDVATDATPDRVRKLFRNTQAVGAAFGVVLVREQQSVIEVATFRTDLEYKDGRHPVGVKFATPEEDAARRDFTINGMFYDPEADRVIDFVGGQEDIRKKVLRAIGDPAQRFAEDHLRLLRAVRFAARFDFTIAETTAEAIARLAPKIISISPERVGEEARLMLTPLSRTVAWNLLTKFAFDEHLFRFLKLPFQSLKTASNGKSTPRIFETMCGGAALPFDAAISAAALEYVAPRTSSTNDASFLIEGHTLVREVVRALRKSLQLSNDESEGVKGILEGLKILLRMESPAVAQLKRFLMQPTAQWSRALLDAVPAAWAGDRDALQRELSTLVQTDYAPAPLLTGDDLNAAGLQPGPAFKRILDAVYDAQLEGRVATKDAALELGLSMRQ